MTSSAQDHRDKLAAGLRLMDSGRFREAEDVFRYILRETPSDPDVICGLAGAALSRKGAQEAFDLLVQARQMHPNHAGLLATLSAAHRALGRIDEALVCIDTAIRLAPREPGHRLARVQLLMMQNRLADALGEVEAGLALADAMPDLLNAKGILLTRQGAPQAAAAAFRAAFAADPGRAEFANNLARTLQDLGQSAEALRFAERAYLSEPGDPAYQRGLARCLVALGRLQEAKETLQAVLALSPNDVAATDMLAALLIATGEEEKGLALCANLVRQTNKSGEACMALARNLRRAGRFEQALGAVVHAKAHPDTEIAATQLEIEINFSLGRAIGHDDLAPPDRPSDADAGKVFVLAGMSLGEALLCARWLTTDMVLHTPPDLAALFAAFGNCKVSTEIPAEAVPLVALMKPAPQPPHGEPVTPYLHLPEEATRPWTDALRNLPGPHIGILWDHAAPGIDLTKLLAAVEGAGTLIALAGDPLRHDLQGFPQICDGGVNISNLTQLASAIAALDLIIAPDSIVAHLAGALGKPGFILVAAGYPWYWRPEDGRSVWYPNLDVVRQTRAGDWDGALADLQARLSSRLACLLQPANL
jgi:tetratricopeptide (TPR) repeat protein